MKDEMKQKVLDIRDLLQSASENINNGSVFEKNISDAEKLVREVQAKNLYLNDLAKITDDLNLLKQQFNKIEVFNESDKNLIHALDSNMGIKIVKIDTALYVIDSKAVI
jgi:hypothetical protein